MVNAAKLKSRIKRVEELLATSTTLSPEKRENAVKAIARAKASLKRWDSLFIRKKK